VRTVDYFTFDLEDGERAGLLRRIRNGGSSIQVVSWGGEWVDHPDGLKYFWGGHGDQLDLVPLTEDEAREALATLRFAERITWRDGDVEITPPAPDAIVTQEELASLSDDKLVALIVSRSTLDDEGAREALSIIRGGPPEGVIY
jgi:hypothetical protein